MNSQKRKRDEDTVPCFAQNGTSVCATSGQTPLTPNERTDINSNLNKSVSSVTGAKRQAGDGFSWWTCLQYDMTLDKTKPQNVKQNQSLGSPALSTTEYQQYEVTSIIQETADTWRFSCRLGNDQNLGLQPGQHVVIRGHVGGKSITRQYTPVSDVNCKGVFQLLIKVYKDGRMSQVVKCWRVGDWLDVRGPFGSLQYTPNQYGRVLMLAAGTGIAPMAQLIQAFLANEAEEGHVRLLYACRTYSDILMKQEIKEWRQFWNFSAVFVLSQEPLAATSSICYQYGEEIVHGKINKALLGKELGEHRSGMRVFVCGTRSFDTDMLQLLQDLNFPEEHTFRF